MAITPERLNEIAQKSEIDTTDIGELDNEYFKAAIQVKPEESMICAVTKKNCE